MGAAIRKAHPEAEIDLVGGGKGDFIVKADGQLLWDKRRMDDEFPEEVTILDRLANV